MQVKSEVRTVQKPVKARVVVLELSPTQAVALAAILANVCDEAGVLEGAHMSSALGDLMDAAGEGRSDWYDDDRSGAVVSKNGTITITSKFRAP